MYPIAGTGKASYLCGVTSNYYTMIEVNDFSYTYGKSRHRVFNGLNLSIGEGRIYGLLGANGVGKTTLLYNILGLLQAQEGSITMDGTDVRLRRPEVTTECFIIPEEFELPPYTLGKYVEIHAPFYPKFSAEDMRRNLALFGMEENPHMGRLSMGQKKKVLMSFAMACNTRLLILDEPTNGLDIPSKSQFRKLITSGMNERRTIIISTHQVADIENILDNVVILSERKVIFDHSIAETGKALLFGENQPEAIYTQPSPGGFYTVSPNREGEESAVRLELLFNAVLMHRERIEAEFGRQHAAPKPAAKDYSAYMPHSENNETSTNI